MEGYAVYRELEAAVTRPISHDISFELSDGAFFAPAVAANSQPLVFINACRAMKHQAGRWIFGLFSMLLS